MFSFKSKSKRSNLQNEKLKKKQFIQTKRQLKSEMQTKSVDIAKQDQALLDSIALQEFIHTFESNDTDGDDDAENEYMMYTEREKLRQQRDFLRRHYYQSGKSQFSDIKIISNLIFLPDITNPYPIYNENTQNIRKNARFLDKYYSTGAFYQDLQDSDSAFQQDFSLSTGMDKIVDKSMLPEIMQTRNFGLKNQTKYTHLRDQDTTLGTQNLAFMYNKNNSQTQNHQDD